MPREDREPAYPVSPAPTLSSEAMAESLASDEEFLQWQFEDRMGLLW